MLVRTSTMQCVACNRGSQGEEGNALSDLSIGIHRSSSGTTLVDQLISNADQHTLRVENQEQRSRPGLMRIYSTQQTTKCYEFVSLSPKTDVQATPLLPCSLTLQAPGPGPCCFSHMGGVYSGCCRSRRCDFRSTVEETLVASQLRPLGSRVRREHKQRLQRSSSLRESTQTPIRSSLDGSETTVSCRGATSLITLFVRRAPNEI